MTLATAAGALLQKQRENVLGVNRRQLATAHDLAPNSLRDLELGLKNPTLERLETVARDVYGLELRILPASGPLADVTGTPVPATA